MDFAKVIKMIDTNSAKQPLNEGWEDMMKANKDKAKEKGTDKFDKKETSTGTTYTRKSSTFSDGGDDKDTKKAKEKAKKSKVKEGDDIDEGFGDMVKKGVETAKKVGSAALDKLGHGSDQDLIKDLQKNAGLPQTGKKPETVSEETVDEDDVEEGNEFSGALAKAKAAGAKDFEVGGKKYKVSESEEKDDNLPPWLKKKKDGKEDSKSDDDKEDSKSKKDEKDSKSDDDKEDSKSKKDKKEEKLDESSLEECYDQAMGQQDQESGMSINSSLDTKTGSKSLTVTASGAAAEQLAQILKLAGLEGQSQQPQEIQVAMGEGDYANEPNPTTQGISAQLQQGNDLNRPKKTYPRVAGGDNPMQAIATMEARADAELAAIEKRLMEQLNSIKLVTKQTKK
jgi:hypothetical protein